MPWNPHREPNTVDPSLQVTPNWEDGLIHPRVLRPPGPLGQLEKWAEAPPEGPRGNAQSCDWGGTSAGRGTCWGQLGNSVAEMDLGDLEDTTDHEPLTELLGVLPLLGLGQKLLL